VTVLEKLIAPVESLIWRVMLVPDARLVIQVKLVPETFVAMISRGAAVVWPAGRAEIWYGGTPPLSIKRVGEHC